MIECSFYEPWDQKSDLITSKECHLWDGEKCLRNENCSKPWATLTNRVRSLDDGPEDD